MVRLSAFLTAAVIVCLLVLPAPAGAQDEPLPFEIQLTIWNLLLDNIDREAEASGLARQRVEEMKGELAEIRTEAQAIKSDFEARFAPFQSQLDALGPPPEEGAPPEPAEIGTQRQRLAENIAEIDGHIRQVEVVIVRADELDQRITRLARRQLFDQLTASFPFPLAPSTIAIAVPEFLAIVAEIVESPFVWWSGLSPDERAESTIRVLIFLPLAIIFGVLIRVGLRRWYGRDPAIAEPTYTRSLAAAVAEAVANGIVPALIFAALYYRANSDASLVSGDFQEFISAFCVAAILIILAWSLTRAVLAPDAPNWRLISVTPENARKISRRISMLSAIVAVDLILRVFDRGDVHSDELISLYILVVSTLEACLLITLTPSALWADKAASTADDELEEDEEPPQSIRQQVWRYVRRGVAVAAGIAIATAFLGFSYLSGYLTTNLVISSVVVGVVMVLRSMLRELIGVAFRSRFLMSRLRIPHRTRLLFRFWFRIVLDVVLAFSVIVIVAPAWGVPQTEVWQLSNRILSGFEVGAVTISIADILLAFFAFFAAIVATRMVQRGLEEQVLPHTRLDIGVRNSIKTGIGYVGIALAAVIAIALLGLDLSNLAIIAGALSVGIGFGLQGVTNNFVSGMILLVERPVKAGDWIRIAEHEGFVRRINVRATEIETFTRASVIIPNSELLSGALTNMTHKDQYGRVDVDVGVAYGSDVDQVMSILQECLDAHPRILRYPESSVVFLGFGESSLDFQARGFIDSVVWRLFVRSDLLVAINRRFQEAGIEIPFPQRDLHIKDIDRLEAALTNRPPPAATPPARPSADDAGEEA